MKAMGVEIYSLRFAAPRQLQETREPQTETGKIKYVLIFKDSKVICKNSYFKCKHVFMIFMIQNRI